MRRKGDWWPPSRSGCAISFWWDSTPACAGAIWRGCSGPGCTIRHRPGRTIQVGEAQESDGHDSADRPSGHDQLGAEATRVTRVYATGWTGVLSRSGRLGSHSHSETGTAARSEFAHTPAYLHQPLGPSRTTA